MRCVFWEVGTERNKQRNTWERVLYKYRHQCIKGTSHMSKENNVRTIFHKRGCIQKFPDWPPGARTANGTVLCHRCSCSAILWVSLVSFAAIILCVASQRVFVVVVVVVVVVYFVIDSVRKVLDTPSLQMKRHNCLQCYWTSDIHEIVEHSKTTYKSVIINLQ
jgi:hypothetical protein